MKQRDLTKAEVKKINAVMKKNGLAEVSNARLENMTKNRAILRYIPNSDARDGALGELALAKAGMQIAYDGDPTTIEGGMDFDTVPFSYVLMVRLPLWKEKKK